MQRASDYSEAPMEYPQGGSNTSNILAEKQQTGETGTQNPTHFSRDLKKLTEAWEHLPPEARQAIAGIVDDAETAPGTVQDAPGSDQAAKPSEGRGGA
jgi:class 3 adenylate cyclase